METPKNQSMNFNKNDLTLVIKPPDFFLTGFFVVFFGTILVAILY